MGDPSQMGGGTQMMSTRGPLIKLPTHLEEPSGRPTYQFLHRRFLRVASRCATRPGAKLHQQPPTPGAPSIGSSTGAADGIGGDCPPTNQRGTRQGGAGRPFTF